MADPMVTLKQGRLQGKKDVTVDGLEYYSFSGIPYAEPPVGKLRFKDPVPASGWQGIRDATTESEPCSQNDFFTGRGYIGSDDCLYLNVYTPKLTSEKPLPVLVYLHGGGYSLGSGSKEEFGPDYLIARDVILVNINYRLGVVGYLCTDAVNARGDMGLKDQSMAIRWVKENIRSFNGDEDNITLLGISAGGASVECHLLSKMSRNLFHKAIIHSASSLNPWARTVNGVNMATMLAKKLGYDSDKTEGLFDFINGFETKQLVEAASTLMEEKDLYMGIINSFTPVINELKDYKGFIEDEPARLLKKGNFYKVPTLSGICSHEGLMMGMFYRPEVMQEMEDGNYVDFVPQYLKNSQDLNTKINSTYNGDTLDFLSDRSFAAGLLYSAEQRIKHNDCKEYVYRFSYEGKLNLLKRMLNIDKPGTCHSDETTYLAPVRFVDHKEATQQDLAVKDTLVTMWTDFAKTGNPTPQSSLWIPATKTDFCYLDISNEVEMKKNLNANRRNLWREIYDNMPLLQKNRKCCIFK